MTDNGSNFVKAFKEGPAEESQEEENHSDKELDASIADKAQKFDYDSQMDYDAEGTKTPQTSGDILDEDMKLNNTHDSFESRNRNGS